MNPEPVWRRQMRQAPPSKAIRLCLMLMVLWTDWAIAAEPSNAPPATQSAAEPDDAKPLPSEKEKPSLPDGKENKKSIFSPAPETTGDTNSADTAPELGKLATTNVGPTNEVDHLREFQLQLELARTNRREKNNHMAAELLTALLQTNAPPELKRPALFELALVSQDENQLVKAQQIFAQYVQTYGEDPSVPEVLLRQGLLYRKMGVNTLAISKFYAVMSTALKLKLNDIDYYKKLVLQAQAEIADTFYLEGKFDEASDFFNRLLKSGTADLDKSEIHYKLIRSLYGLTNHTETVAKAETFLELYPKSPELPEVRFLLASTLKKVGRNQDSMKQVLLLLQSQEENARKNPKTWIFWQQRAGNEIANQLYKEGDYLNALEIYLNLSDLDKSPAWQLPVWYQSALIYEQLQQWQKATEMYARIIARKKDLTDANGSPSLVSLIDMAKWRSDYLGWMDKARVTSQSFQSGVTNSPAPVAAK